jgi:hypothetical protein
MMRQIAGSFAEYEKARLVAKLKAARERKRLATGKCEGRKSHAEINPEMVHYRLRWIAWRTQRWRRSTPAACARARARAVPRRPSTALPMSASALSVL